MSDTYKCKECGGLIGLSCGCTFDGVSETIVSTKPEVGKDSCQVKEWWLDPDYDGYFDDTKENLIASGFTKVVERSAYDRAVEVACTQAERIAKLEAQLIEKIKYIEDQSEMFPRMADTIPWANKNHREAQKKRIAELEAELKDWRNGSESEAHAGDEARSEAKRLRTALEKNKAEWEAVSPDGYKNLVAWQVARKALKDE